MSGHSKWATTKHKKQRNDAARQKLWGKLCKEISTAARTSADPDANPRLRAAMLKARSNSVPNRNIDSAIAVGSGANAGVAPEELLYEGYGPGGTAFVVTCLTDNKVRTVANIRNIFSKSGGAMGETNSVAWNFKHSGYIAIEKGAATEEQVMDLALEAGADDIETGDEVYEITTALDTFDAVSKAFDAAKIAMVTAETTYIPGTPVPVSEADMAAKINRMVERFEDDEDVQEVFHNAEFAPGLEG